MRSQREFNYYVCQLMLTMLDRGPGEGEVEEVMAELRSAMAQWEPTRPPSPRVKREQAKLGGDDGPF